MKFNIKQAREIYPQVLGESNKEFKSKCLRLFITGLIEDLGNIKDHMDFDAISEYDYKKKKGKIIIEFKLK